MANIIGLTTETGKPVMVNADHIIRWHSDGSIPHPFKPYASIGDICVQELPGGDTCNNLRDDHQYSHIHLSNGEVLIVQEDIHTINERIDVIQAALETWMDEE